MSANVQVYESDINIRIFKESYKRFKIISTKKQMPLKYLFDDMLCKYENEIEKIESSLPSQITREENKERKVLNFLKYK